MEGHLDRDQFRPEPLGSTGVPGVHRPAPLGGTGPVLCRDRVTVMCPLWTDTHTSPWFYWLRVRRGCEAVPACLGCPRCQHTAHLEYSGSLRPGSSRHHPQTVDCPSGQLVSSVGRPDVQGSALDPCGSDCFRVHHIPLLTPTQSDRWCLDRQEVKAADGWTGSISVCQAQNSVHLDGTSGPSCG